MPETRNFGQKAAVWSHHAVRKSRPCRPITHPSAQITRLMEVPPSNAATLFRAVGGDWRLWRSDRGHVALSAGRRLYGGGAAQLDCSVFLARTRPAFRLLGVPELDGWLHRNRWLF